MPNHVGVSQTLNIIGHVVSVNGNDVLGVVGVHIKPNHVGSVALGELATKDETVGLLGAAQLACLKVVEVGEGQEEELHLLCGNGECKLARLHKLHRSLVVALNDIHAGSHLHSILNVADEAECLAVIVENRSYGDGHVHSIFRDAIKTLESIAQLASLGTTLIVNVNGATVALVGIVENNSVSRCSALFSIIGGREQQHTIGCDSCEVDGTGSSHCSICTCRVLAVAHGVGPVLEILGTACHEQTNT